MRPADLKGYIQCHFFAGIGVWSYALRQAGVADDTPLWTGSCPCQPFSAAGKGAGFDDERHLWPAWQHLIAECRPRTVFGEQVAAKNAEPWLDLVQSDMEALGYAFGAVAFPSAGIGAPHIRDRTYFVAHAAVPRHDEAGQHERGSSLLPARPPEHGGVVRPASPTNGFWRNADWLECRDGKFRPVESRLEPMADGLAHRLGYSRIGDTWALDPLITKAENRVGRLRGYGNAICAPAAQAFIEAVIY